MKRKKLLLIITVLSPIYCFAIEAPIKAAETPIKSVIPTGIETWIAFLPGIFFVLILLVSSAKVRKSSSVTTGLLAEKDPATIRAFSETAEKSAALNALKLKADVGTTTNDTTAPAVPQSTSRFLALITGLVALSIGVCISIFYMYSYFSNPAKPVELSNLTNVIWGLGIGVIPYGFNKTASAVKQP